MRICFVRDDSFGGGGKLGLVRGGQMRLKGRFILVDFIKEDRVGCCGVAANIEDLAARLGVQGACGIVPDQRHKAIHLAGLDPELHRDDIHCLFIPCPFDHAGVNLTANLGSKK